MNKQVACTNSATRMKALLRLIHKLVYPALAPHFHSHRIHRTAARH